VTNREITFEIHLPQVIGSRVFETEKSVMLGCFSGFDHLVTFQNSGNGAGTGHLRLSQVEQSLLQLATTPGRMLAPQTEHRVFYQRRRFPGRVMWSSGAIG
jgi:hypothetical protein